MGLRTGLVEVAKLGAIQGARILAVDDGEANVLLLQRMLERAGAALVEGLNDPRLAVQTFHRIQPDIVLLDMHMPYMDGLQVLEALQEAIPASSPVPIVMLTADNTIEARHRALASGAKDFIAKPFEQIEVLLRIQNLLETRALHLAVQRHNLELEEDLRRRTEADRDLATERAARVARIENVLTNHAIEMVYQPIVHLGTGQMHGMEALARFSQGPQRPPDQWFAEAATIGKGPELEMLAIESALRNLDRIPGQVYLSVNLDPETIFDERLIDCIGPRVDRVVVELTEHTVVQEYERLARAMDPLREAGVRFAVDDAGSGFASLRHILRLRPDIIKLDRDLTWDIDRDPARRALATALVRFADELGSRVVAEGIETDEQLDVLHQLVELGSRVVAEGIETDEQLDVLRQLGVESGQGYLLGRPAPLPAAGADQLLVITANSE